MFQPPSPALPLFVPSQSSHLAQRGTSSFRVPSVPRNNLELLFLFSIPFFLVTARSVLFLLYWLCL